MHKSTPETGGGLQNTIRQLCDDTGVTFIAKEIGFIDQDTNQISQLKEYDGNFLVYFSSFFRTN